MTFAQQSLRELAETTDGSFFVRPSLLGMAAGAGAGLFVGDSWTAILVGAALGSVLVVAAPRLLKLYPQTQKEYDDWLEAELSENDSKRNGTKDGAND